MVLARRIVKGRHVGQIWRLKDGRVGMITDSGGEGGWIIQDTDDSPPFCVDYNSAFLVELVVIPKATA